MFRIFGSKIDKIDKTYRVKAHCIDCHSKVDESFDKIVDAPSYCKYCNKKTETCNRLLTFDKFFVDKKEKFFDYTLTIQCIKCGAEHCICLKKHPQWITKGDLINSKNCSQCNWFVFQVIKI